MKILNFGSLNRDLVYAVDHAVLPGETLASSGMEPFCGGKGLNQSLALARAGAAVYHAGCIGSDGSDLILLLQDSGVDTRHIRRVDGPSGHAIIQVDANGQNSIILYGGTNRQFTHGFVDEVLEQCQPGDVIVLQNEINNIPYIMEQAWERGLRIAFNAAPYDDSVRQYPLDKVTWLIVNEVEGAGLSDETEPEKILDALEKAYPRTNVLLTLGKDGAIYAANGVRTRVKACSVKAVDTTAAGDTFIGFFLRGILDGRSQEETLKLATVASAIAVTRPGAADSVPSYAEVIDSELYRNFQ